MWEIILASTLGVAIAVVALARVFFGQLPALWLENENIFVNPSTKKTEKFPSLWNTSPSLYLSIIVPSYNEEERLPVMLDETFEYLKTRQSKDTSFTYEIIVVDDGSKDKTTQVALEYAQKLASKDVLRVLTLKKNRGKGGAVKRGMMCARGKYLLMVDADGATKFADIDNVEAKLKAIERDDYGIGIGSRAHLEEKVVRVRKWYRNILMWGFHFLVAILCVKGIKDTQCGFKLFTRKAAAALFPNQHIERWAFDVELIYLAYCKHIPMVEVPVNWTEIPGSKLTPFAASVQMGKDLLRIRLAYMLRIWTIPS